MIDDAVTDFVIRLRKVSVMKKRMTLALAILLALSTSVATADSRQKLNLRKQTRELVSQERYDEAVKLYTEAATKATEDDEMQAHCLGEAAELTLGRLKDADKALELASQIRDEQRKAALRLQLLEDSNQYAKVVEEFADADVSAWPMEVQMQSYASRARAFMETGKADKGAADLEKGVKIVGHTATRMWMCYELGSYYEKAGEKDKAMETYAYAISVTPAYYSYRNRCFLSYSQMLIDKGELQKAMELFKDIDYDKFSNDYWRGSFYLLEADVQAKQGNQGQAAMILTKVLRLPDVNTHHKAEAEKQLAAISSQM